MPKLLESGSQEQPAVTRAGPAYDELNRLQPIRDRINAHNRLIGVDYGIFAFGVLITSATFYLSHDIKATAVSVGLNAVSILIATAGMLNHMGQATQIAEENETNEITINNEVSRLQEEIGEIIDQ